MKRFFPVIFLIFIAGGSLFAWEPNDLTKYPKFTKEGDWILNLGVGLGHPLPYSDGYIYIPHVRLSFDRNTPLGDIKLPFFFGGIVGYSGEGYVDDWYVNKISLGFRVGYHLNWGIDNFDTYAVTTLGWIIHAGNNYQYHYPLIGHFLFNINVGARYFISKGFGFWVEFGYGYLPLSWVDIGLSFKF